MIKQRSVSRSQPTCSAHELYKAASSLLRAELPCTLRLLGVRVSGLVDESEGRTAGQLRIEDALRSVKSQRNVRDLSSRKTDMDCQGGSGLKVSEDVVTEDGGENLSESVKIEKVYTVASKKSLLEHYLKNSNSLKKSSGTRLEQGSVFHRI